MPANNSLQNLTQGLKEHQQKQQKETPLYGTKKDFSPKQQAFMQQPLKDLNILVGAVRSGKTYISLFKWCQFVQSAPSEAPLLMVGRTLTTLERNCLKLLIEIAGQQNFKYSLSKKEGTLYGRPVYLEGADDSSSEHKIRGLTLMGAYVDEITILPQSFWEMLLTRLSMQGAALLGTTNPDGPAHWLNKNYIKNTKLNIATWNFTFKDNPYLADDYYEKLKNSFAGLAYERFVLGKWVQAAGSVYKCFDADIHVRSLEWFKQFTRSHNIITSTAGGDIGQSTSATTLYNTAFTRGFEFVIVTEEYYNPNNEDADTIINDYCNHLRQWKFKYRLAECRIDSADHLIRKSVRRRRTGVAIWPSLKRPINERIKMTEILLKQNRLFILESCPNLIEALQSAVWNPHGVKEERLDNGTTKIDPLSPKPRGVRRKGAAISKRPIKPQGTRQNLYKLLFLQTQTIKLQRWPLPS
jgi:PBSX family phage terminase large subunit